MSDGDGGGGAPAGDHGGGGGGGDFGGGDHGGGGGGGGNDHGGDHGGFGGGGGDGGGGGGGDGNDGNDGNGGNAGNNAGNDDPNSGAQAGGGGDDMGAAAMSANNNDYTDMALPITVAAPHMTEMHDGTMDRPPDPAYNEGRLADSSPTRAAVHVVNPFSQHHGNLDLDDYFKGPRDIQKHSKWPMFLQMHGSILPKMVLPLVAVGSWATMVSCVSYFTSSNLGISSILLTVTGFVVGLGLSFRSSTAYERYGEGRRYWAQLMLASQTLGRVFWVHAVERPNNKDKDILTKLTGLNLVVAFAVALKHRLRHEPYTGYEDLVNLVGHLDTYSNTATIKEPEKLYQTRPGIFKLVGEYLGVSFAASNPRKAIKRSGYPLGNLPLEILTYLACYIDEMVTNSQLVIPMHQTLAYNNMAVMNDVLMGTERVLTTPLPIAYSIAISQVTWLYVFLLPFQLYPVLQWVTIPATVVASYIILGILFIGREIENPFGQDVNDLPLENYCSQIAADIDLITSRKKHRNRDWVESAQNKVLLPLSQSGWPVWKERGELKVREALRTKFDMTMRGRGDLMGQDQGHNVDGRHHLGHELAQALHKNEKDRDAARPENGASEAGAAGSSSSASAASTGPAVSAISGTTAATAKPPMTPRDLPTVDEEANIGLGKAANGSQEKQADADESENVLRRSL